MTFEERANKLIGLQYDIKTYHCWHLVCDLLPNAPRIEATATTLSALKAMNQTYPSLKEIKEPTDRCVVLMGNKDVLIHAGVYYKGGIIHAELAGVVYETIGKMRLRWGTMRYYNVD